VKSTKLQIIKIFGLSIFLMVSAYAAKKTYMHVIDQTICNQCGDCIKGCPEGAIKATKKGGKIIHEIDPALCNQCGVCIDHCKLEAINAVEIKNTPKAK
jgi:NAD-dependent dihydropyrimidine dehydrogenase PreA subunit